MQGAGTYRELGPPGFKVLMRRGHTVAFGYRVSLVPNPQTPQPSWGLGGL